MKLVNGFKLMEYAKRNNFVLPAFNTTNLEMTYAIVDGLMKANLPGYIQISSNNLRLSNPAIITDIAADAVKKSETPIGLHLDHGKSFEDVKACIDAGFTSIMIDASHLPFEENVKECRRAADYCHFYGIPVEAELGALRGKEEDIVNEAECKTDPAMVAEFVEKTRCVRRERRVRRADESRICHDAGGCRVRRGDDCLPSRRDGGRGSGGARALR